MTRLTVVDGPANQVFKSCTRHSSMDAGKICCRDTIPARVRSTATGNTANQQYQYCLPAASAAMLDIAIHWLE